MKVKLSGDHSAYHCGCQAVWEVLTGAVLRNGGEVVAHGDYDVLIVNGEGSMHHGRPTFHRKMQELKAALEAGKRAYLVNSVWHSNPPDYDNVLTQLSGVCVREAASARDLLERHGVAAKVCLDFSYFRDVSAPSDEEGEREIEYVTDYLDPSIGNFAPMPEEFVNRRQLLTLSSLNWDDTVSMLRGGRLLVTGRHHAVYAACRARCPFAAIEGNSHKIAGLVRMSETSIPVAEDISELPYVIDWARSHPEEFERLFDWMDEYAATVTPLNVLPACV